MNTRHLFLLAVVTACADQATMLRPMEPSLAKGGTTTQRADFSISNAGMSLTSDGNGTYVDGICGVTGSWTSSVTLLSPAGARVPKSQQASCTGIAPRVATLSLATRHLSDSPHVDDAASPAGSGAYGVVNVKFGWGGANATTINSSAPCGTAGLRYTPVTYPGTSSVERVDLGGGLWHMYTRPWPDDIAYCELNGAATYWHVAMDMQVQIR